MKTKKAPPPGVADRKAAEALVHDYPPEKYHPGRDLSSGGSVGNELKDLRLKHSLSGQEMADTVQAIYPRFDRYLLSKCESPELYGVDLRQEGIKALYEKYDPALLKKLEKPKDYHRLTCSIRCRLETDVYRMLIAQIHMDGFDTVQAWLTDHVLAYINARSDDP